MKKTKLKLRLRSIIILTIISLIVICIGLFSIYKHDIGSIDFKEEVVTFEIKKGSNLNTVLNDLEDAKLIYSALSAKIYAKMNNLSTIRAGVYELENGMNVDQILKHFDGNNAIVNESTVTIIEGTWAVNIAKAISEKTNVTQDELMNLWNDKEFVKEMIEKYNFLSEDVFHDESHVFLEGFLFPDTYTFFAETTPREITLKILDHTKLVMDEYLSEVDSPYTLYELMSLASIVQFEANNPTDMKMVAGVFLKRLEIGMPLQSSASVCYALYDDFKNQNDCEYNIYLESKYNTYYVDKFPIGPICNPGKDAIEAVIKPTKSDYLYFVNDSEYKNHYAKTYEEHLKNIDKYLK